MSHGPTLVALLILVTGLAGCAGGAPSGGEVTGSIGPDGNIVVDDPASETRVTTSKGDEVAANRGVFRGRVRDDTNFSIVGARVSLMGTAHYTQTGPGGTFRMDDVIVGNWTARVEPAAGYNVVERPVEIRAGQTTEVEFLVLPSEEREGGFRPHMHDLWAGATTYEMANVRFVPYKGYSNAPPGRPEAIPMLVYPNTNNTNPTNIPFVVLGASSTFSDGYPIPLPKATDPSHPPVVIPGTGTIQIRMSWAGPETSPTTLGVYAEYPGIARRWLGEKPSGSTWTIQGLNESHTDSGHQKWSDWRFFIHSANDVQTEAGSGYSPAVMLGEVSVVITLIKGFEPGVDDKHDDFWRGNETVTYTATRAASILSVPGVQRFFLKKNEVIPPGAGRMRLELTWDYTTLPADLPVPPYTLAWRTGAQNPYTTTRSDWVRRAPDASTPTSRTFEFPLLPTEPDPFYRDSSNWNWYILYDAPNEQVADLLDNYLRPGDVTFTLKITAFKDPALIDPV